MSIGWGKQRLHFWRARTKSVHTVPQEKGAVTLQETGPDPAVVLGGLLGSHESAGAHRGDGVPGAAILGEALLKVAISPTLELVDPKAGFPQAKLLTGR